MPEIKNPSPELLPETDKESAIEIEPKDIRTVPEEKPVASTKEWLPSASPAVSTPLVLDEPIILQHKIESVLEEDLSELFRELNPAEQAKFKAAGEATARKISVLLREVKVKINEILELVRIWLMSISGINKYFAEQEAKIKAEKILKLRQQK